MKVVTPTGTWHVRRRWAPRSLGSRTIWARFWDRTRSVRRRTSDAADVGDPGCVPDIGEAIAVFIVAIVIVLFLVFIGIPFLVALGELVFLLLLAIGGVVGRVVFRRPWTIDAVDPSGVHHTWSIVGWRASSSARRFIAERVAAGGAAPTHQEVQAAVAHA